MFNNIILLLHTMFCNLEKVNADFIVRFDDRSKLSLVQKEKNYMLQLFLCFHRNPAQI